MDIRKISDTVSVSPQVTAGEMREIAAAGFRSIICNRPDVEEMNQPTFEEIDAAAKAEGLETCFLPVVAGNITDQIVEEFRAAVSAMPKPVLAYCRSGTRCTILWSLSKAGELSAADIMAATQAAGYDMRGLLPRIGDTVGSSDESTGAS